MQLHQSCEEPFILICSSPIFIYALFMLLVEWSLDLIQMDSFNPKGASVLLSVFLELGALRASANREALRALTDPRWHEQAAKEYRRCHLPLRAEEE